GCNGPYGVLGTGVAEGQRYVPARVTLPGVSNVAEVAAGSEFSMVLLKTGEVLTWGRSLYGQLGNGSTVNSLTPVRAAAPYGIAHIAAKLQSAIAVRTLAQGGSVFTWGDNTFGQLGQRTTEPFSATPKREAARINGVTQVATSGDTDLVLTSSGTVWGWGSNNGGKLTRPDTANQPAPVQLTALNGASQVTVGVLNGAAIRTDGTVWA